MANWFVDDAASDNLGTGAWNDPIKYLWKADGSSNPGLFNLATPPAAGDTVYVLDGHSEISSSGAITLTNNGTDASPIKIINVSSFASGTPTTLGAARGCTVGHSVTANALDIIHQTGLFIYGFSFDVGDEFKGTSISGLFHMQGCRINIKRSGSYRANLGGSNTGQCRYRLDDVWFKFASIGYIAIEGATLVSIRGGKLESGATGTDLFHLGANGFALEIDGLDASAFTGTNIINRTSTDETGFLNARNMKLPSGKTLYSPGTVNNINFTAVNCDSAVSSNELYWRKGAGSVTNEGTIVRTGGAAFSYLMSPDSNVSILDPCVSPDIGINADFSSSKTIDIYIGNNTRDLTDQEITVELTYPAYNAGGGKTADSNGTNYLVSATTHTDDTGSTWGGAGLTYMQKITITAGGATDGRRGEAQLRVKLAVGVDVYVDPLPVVA